MTEVAKQIAPLTTQQRGMLISLLFELQLPIDELNRMANSVIQMRTYGSIAFEYWIAERVVTGDDLKAERAEIFRLMQRYESEVERRVQDQLLALVREAERSIVECKKITGDPVAAHAVTLRLEAERWEESRRQYFAKLRGEHKRRLKSWGTVLRQMSEEDRRKILDNAVEVGIIENYDQAMVDHIWMFPDKLEPVLQAMGRTLA